MDLAIVLLERYTKRFMSREIKCRCYAGIILFGMVILLFVFGRCYTQLCDQVLNHQKNVIGFLSRTSISSERQENIPFGKSDEIYTEKHIQNYIQAIFEPLTQEQMEQGMQTLKSEGYTELGIYYIGEAMGLYQYGYMQFILCGLACIVLFFVYKIMQTQYQEIDALKQEIYSLKQAQLKEEYVSEQNKRIQSFIENIVHQMKTPLSRVFSSLDIVESRLEEEAMQKYVEECYQHLESINGLMKQLIDIGRLEAGKVMFQKEKFYVKELLAELRSSVGLLGKRVQISCDEALEYYGDAKWLKEAFVNILCNALEADKSEEIIEVTSLKNEDYIKISIRDHGLGLSEKDIPKIFDRFYLPENVRQNHVGIGLNLAKLVVEGHKGSVYVYNHAEGGAVFQVLLPVYETLKVR